MIDTKNGTYTFYTIISNNDDYSEEYFETKKDAIESIQYYADEWWDGKELEIFVESYDFDINDILLEFEDEINEIINEHDNEITELEAIKYIDKTDFLQGNISYYNNNEYEMKLNDINENIDELISDVIDKLKKIFTNISKYSKIYIYLKNEKEPLTVKMRISDHTYNPHNGANDINVVITNADPTKHKFFTASPDLIYDSSDNADSIVAEICETIFDYLNILDINEIDYGESDIINFDKLKEYLPPSYH